MATWKTAAELARTYSVGLERLLGFSRRGNLPMCVGSDGTPLFDEDIVSRLFRSRRSSFPPAEAPNLGVLGEARLGGGEPIPLEPALSARDARRRALRVGNAADVADEPVSERGRTGTR